MLIDNLLSKSHFSFVQGVICGQSLSWNHITNTSGSESEETSEWSDSFYHIIYQHADMGGDLLSHGVYQIMIAPLLIALDRQGLELDTLYRIRAGLITKKPHRVIHGKHIDFTEPYHPPNLNPGLLKTSLFYLNDSDGPTYIYDNNDKIIEEVDPVANRWYTMPNDVLHASSTPTETQVRYVVNYNYSVR